MDTVPLNVTAQDIAGNALEDAEVTLLDGGGNPQMIQVDGVWIPVALTDDKGMAQGFVPVGEYLVTVDHAVGSFQYTWTASPPRTPMLNHGVDAWPIDPIDGDEIRYKVEPGVIWTLRYDASIGDAFKWVYVGGSPLFKYVEANEALTTPGVWQDLATIGPQFVVPRSGWYLLDLAATCATPAVVSAYTAASYAIPGVAEAVFPDCINMTTPMAGILAGSPARTLRKQLVAGQTIKMRYIASHAGGACYRRSLQATPERIG
jgi:hypothetical protein